MSGLSEFHRRLLLAIQHGTIQAGDMAHANVLHDSDCPLLINGGTCACDPEISLHIGNRVVKIDRDGRGTEVSRH